MPPAVLSGPAQAVAGMVRAFPPVLGLSPERNIEPKLAWLKEELDLDEGLLVSFIRVRFRAMYFASFCFFLLDFEVVLALEVAELCTHLCGASFLFREKCGMGWYPRSRNCRAACLYYGTIFRTGATWNGMVLALEVAVLNMCVCGCVQCSVPGRCGMGLDGMGWYGIILLCMG